MANIVLDDRPKIPFSPTPGHIIPLTNDKMFRAFCRQSKSKRYVSKLINLVSKVPYELLVDNLKIIDSTLTENSISNHFNTQDLVLNVKNMTFNLEMCTNRYKNKRKNEITAHKISGNQYKAGESFENTIYFFYQICFETYNLFNNNLSINEVNLVNVSSGNHEVETKEFKKFHVNLSSSEDIVYNNDVEEKYLKFLKEDNIEELKKLAEGDEILMEAYETLEALHCDALFISEQEEKELDEYCIRAGMKDAYEDGKTAGFERGKSAGFESGKSVGFESGKNVGKMENQVEIAKNLINLNISIDTIIEATGLTKEELENLKSN